MDQGEREIEPAPHSPRVGRGVAIRHLFQLYQLQKPRDLRIDALVGKMVEAPMKLEHLPGGCGFVEPYLLQEGYLKRTPRGRVATPLAFRHLGLTPPAAGTLWDDA